MSRSDGWRRSNIILNRANDGAFPANPEIFTGSTAPGQWRPTPPGFAPMAGPWIGNMKPFVQKDTEGQLHEPAAAVTDQRSIHPGLRRGEGDGAADQQCPDTPQETTMALFFSGNTVTMVTGVVRSVASARLNDIGDSARLFALAYVSASDSAINAWNNKREIQRVEAQHRDPQRRRRRQSSHR